MTNCNNIKRLIDETEQPDVLPFAATHHLNACAPCRQFADERASLRALLNGMPRVNAPMNFDAQLKARITTAKAKPAFAWSSPALYLRFGAAAAALVAAVFVGQYNGMFSLTNNSASTTPVITITPPTQVVEPGSSGPIAKEKVDPDIEPSPTKPPVEPAVSPIYVATTPDRGNRGKVRPGAVPLEGESTSDRVPGFIVRSSGREVELPMLPVSLGAQQQLINRSSRSSRSAVQPIAISF
jgi:hypothetical protein